MKCFKVFYRKPEWVDGGVVHFTSEVVYMPASSEEEAVQKLAVQKDVPIVKEKGMIFWYTCGTQKVRQEVVKIQCCGDGFLTLEQLRQKIKAAVVRCELLIVKKWLGVINDDTESLAVPGGEGQEAIRVTPLEALYYIENGVLPTLGNRYLWIFVPSINFSGGWQDGEYVDGWSRPWDAESLDATPVSYFIPKKK